MARAKNRVTDTDKGWKRIFQTAKELSFTKPFVKVGFLANETDESVITVALSNEFGVPSKNVPERSFVRAAFDKNKAELNKLLQQLVGGIYDGKMTPERALGIAGAKLAADIKTYVTQGPPIPPPNAPATLERKLGLTGSHAHAAKSAEASVSKRAGMGAALFGDHGDTTQMADVRAAAKKAAFAKALRRAQGRVKQARAAAAVFGGAAGVRTLVDTGRMLASITWQVVSRRGGKAE